MRLSRHKEIAELLLANPDGLTRTEISQITGAHPDGMKHTLASMYGVYIDRWFKSPKNGRMTPVYCIVEVPQDCPKP